MTSPDDVAETLGISATPVLKIASSLAIVPIVFGVRRILRCRLVMSIAPIMELNGHSMAIREMINRSPIIVVGTVLLALLIVSFIIFRQVKELNPAGEYQMFFTVDDGKTWFAADKSNVSPFEKNGKVAVRANVYQCKDAKEPFVGYMERYTESARKQMVDLIAEAKASPEIARSKAGFIQGVMRDGIQYKKPGDKDWSKQNVAVNCPSGRTEDMERVLPGR